MRSVSSSVANQHVAVLHQAGHHATRFGLTPELAPVVEIDARLHAGHAGGFQRFQSHVGSRCAKGRRNARHVEPSASREDSRPVDHARPDAGDRRAFAVVKDAAGPRSCAEFKEVDAHSVIVGPDDVTGIDSCFTRMVNDKPAQRIARQPRHPGSRTPQPGQANRCIQFRSPDFYVESSCLFKAMEIRRTQPDHRFAESHHVMRHALALCNGEW